jgi:hypothetical protein
MKPFDVFHVKPDGSFVWVGSADSLQAAHEMIRASHVVSSDAFLIHDFRCNSTVTIRPDELLV